MALSAGIGLRQPSPPDEPRFVLAARAMVDTGQWLLPHRGIELYAEKPPVFMWLQAASFRLVHDWKVAFLLPSLLAALLTLWLSWDLARRLWNRRVAWHAPLALFCTLQFGLMAKRGQIDMVLVAMTTLALWGILRHLLRGPDWTAWCIGVFAAGVGTVTKGVGFLPLLVLLPWAAWRLRSPVAARTAVAATWASVLPLFLAGTAVWLLPLAIALVRADDPQLAAYARELLLKQTGTRYTAAWHHIQPAWYYLQVIATVWLPGCLLLPWLLPAWWHRLRRGDGRYVLLLSWCVLVLIFFSASPGKREVYIFPMLPALCVAAAPLLPALLRRRTIRRLLAAYTAVMAFAALAVGSGLLIDAGWTQRLAIGRGIDVLDLAGSAVWLSAFGLTTLAALLWSRLRQVGVAVVVMTVLLWSMYGLGLMPVLDSYSSSAGLMRRVDARIGPEAELGMVAWREQNMLQADRHVVDFGFKQSWDTQWRLAGTWLQQAPQTRWVFVLKQAMSVCVDSRAVIDIGQSNRNQWQLVPGTAWRPGCVQPELERDMQHGAGDGDRTL